MTRYSRNSPPVIVKITGTIERDTTKAILIKNIVKIDDEPAEDVVEDLNKLKEQWFPLSCIHKIIRTNTKGTDEIHVEEWLCINKGFF